MDSKKLEEIKARVEAATQGPWEIYKDHLFSAFDRYGISTYFEWPVCKAGGNLTAQNAEFIAHAREDIPALVIEVERLQAIIEQLQQEIKDNNDIGLPGLPPRSVYPELYEELDL